MNVNQFVNSLTIGMDPELFIWDRSNSEYVGAAGLVEGTKSDPCPIGDGLSVQKDGLALEFNRGPMSWPEFCNYSPSEDLVRLNAYVNRHNPSSRRYQLHTTPVAFFSEAVMSMQDEADLELGCDPDFNAFTGKANPQPKVYGNYRCAGGHIHIGWTNGEDPFDAGHYDMCRVFAYLLSRNVGGYFSFHDERCNFRQSLYGKPGSFRPKPYGLEWRSPPNQWLTDDGTENIRNYIMFSVEDGADVQTSANIPNLPEQHEVVRLGAFHTQQRTLIEQYGLKDFVTSGGDVFMIETSAVERIAAE